MHLQRSIDSSESFSSIMTKDILKKRANLRMHVCDLPRTSGSNLPKLPPNAKFYSRWKRNLQKLVLVSTQHPLTQLIFRSQAAVAFEKRRHSRSSNQWIIHPCSMLRFYWDAIMTVTFLYIFMTAPHITCFYRIGKNSGPEYWNIVYPSYFICIIDIFFNFITGVVSPDRHEVLLDAALIARNYAKGYFFIDFISSLPYMWFYPVRILPSGPNSNSVFLIVEFLPILKIIRIPTLQRYVQQINKKLGTSETQKTTIWLIILTLLIFHWSSCISYVFPYIVMHIQERPMKNSDTYYSITELYNEPNWRVYLIFVHIGVSNLIGSGFMEFDNFGIYDKVIRCTLLLLGKGYTIYLIVTILELLESLAEPELKYQGIMQQVKEYIRQKKLPLYLRDKLIFYYEYRYQGNFFKENVIFDTLSDHLNQEILFHSSASLLDTMILHTLSRNVLGDLINLIRPVIYLTEEIIYKAGTDSDYMYFIASGTVALITFSGREICHLHDGEHFGEAAMVYPDRRRTESVITLEVCELFRLHRRDFKCLFAKNSDFYISLEYIAQEHLQKIKKLDGEGDQSERK
ncbi:potassium/sodium hyperpolarization-activated cyclic nucleotide-gated channel 1-like [Anoplolepis gracilipes]|uniref:potassium/sodium hyperpolarization-activated cyclic nucleotide-gated channel 1-like n=1 Tax=Anoplolepis gracilipes TaxID=354296 RepID=UPI003BA1792F